MWLPTFGPSPPTSVISSAIWRSWATGCWRPRKNTCASAAMTIGYSAISLPPIAECGLIPAGIFGKMKQSGSRYGCTPMAETRTETDGPASPLEAFVRVYLDTVGGDWDEIEPQV